MNLDYYIYIRPLLARTSCGDIGLFKDNLDELFFCLIDVSGHGVEAFNLAIKATNFIERNFTKSLDKLTHELHAFLRGSRGLAANFGRIEKKSGNMEYVGIGNVLTKIHSNISYSLINQSGVIGYQIPSVRVQHIQLLSGDALLMFSDGVTETLSSKYTIAPTASSECISRDIVQRFGKGNDDASCLFLRYN